MVGAAGGALSEALSQVASRLGALVAEVMLNAFSGGFWALAGLGALTVFGVGAFSMAI